MQYVFHLTFTNGGNPYKSFPAAEKAHKAALKKWQREYTLTLDKRSEGPAGIIIEWYTATEKRPQIDLFGEGLQE